MLLGSIKDGDWTGVRKNFQKLGSLYLGERSAPVFSGLTLTNLTAGSVLFAGTNGVISQDNDKLFWDAANFRLGIRTATPANTLHILADDANGQLRLEKTTASGKYVALKATDAGNFEFRTTGTFWSWDGSYPGQQKAIRIWNESSDANSGVQFQIYTQQSTSGDPILRFSINPNVANWSLGIDNSDSDKFKISAASALGTSTALTIDSNLDIALGRKVLVGSFASPTDVTNAGPYGFEIHYSGNNYDVTGIRSRAQLVTTDTAATALGGLFQAANNDNINAGVLMGFMAEAIGKSTSNASTITTMRGGLIGTEWGALDTVTNLKTLHLRGHSRNAVGAGSFGTGYALYIENEAVGGNGQAYDAGIYFKGTNLSAGNKAFTYGIDFSSGTYGTAEMLIGNAKIASSANDLIIQPITDSTTFLQVLDADGGNPTLTIDSTNERIKVGEISTSPATFTVRAATFGPLVDNVHYDQYVAAVIEDGEGRLQFIANDDGNNAGSFIMTNVPASGDNKHWVMTHRGPNQNNNFQIGYEVTASSGLDIPSNADYWFTIPITGGFLAEANINGEYVIQAGTINGYSVLRIVSGANEGAGFYLSNDLVNPQVSANSSFGMFSRPNSFAEHIFFVGDTAGNQFVFTNLAHRLLNFDHAVQTNPTIFIHSDISPNTNNTQWLSLAHDQTDAVFGIGTGEYVFRHTAPYLQLHNTTHEDSDGGRESRINFKGEQGVSPFEETTLARIEVSHDGSGADDKGKIVISTNDGNDGDTPTTAITIDSSQNTYLTGLLGLAQKAGTTTDGDLWNDSTQEALQTFVSGIEQTLVGVIFTQTADQTIVDTTTETTLLGTGVGTLTLPANFWVVGKTIRIEIHGDFADTANPTVEIQVYYGETSLIDSQAITLSGLGGTEEWECEVVITCRSVGGSGTVQTVIDWEYETTTGSSPIERLDVAGVLQTIDTTASGVLDVTFQWGTADAANSLISEVAFVEVLN